MKYAESLADYFTGPCVALHSMGLQMGGTNAVAAKAFFAARSAIGITGYVTKEEAISTIEKLTKAS